MTTDQPTTDEGLSTVRGRIGVTATDSVLVAGVSAALLLHRPGVGGPRGAALANDLMAKDRVKWAE